LLLVLALHLALRLDPEQCWNQPSELLLMMYLNAIGRDEGHDFAATPTPAAAAPASFASVAHGAVLEALAP
jgi:hypothetical protein